MYYTTPQHLSSGLELSPCYFASFRIRRHIGLVAYDLELPPFSKIHSVIHVSQLKAYHGTHQLAPFCPLPPDLHAIHAFKDKSISFSTDLHQTVVPTVQNLPDPDFTSLEEDTASNV
ncbi:unnamed protein product [Vicia faba]|uniref:Tf2-1-like SH3-like domain-containing protein n=1 Tax=Vicia faba TaxID=3906 RepID=A0AAV0ZDY6_VICFA|nr:unnamed protein product [Vicia faba]